jgi:bifunctional non-homologous end joining protein LigD
MNTESIALYYREGASDKVYQARIEPAGNLFVVNFAFGRRGSNLSTGTKTNNPVEYEQARTIYEKLVREKKANGYTEGQDGNPYEHTAKANEYTGILPQLLNPVEQSELEHYFDDLTWCMQEKFDGRRMLIRKHGQEITGINRKGIGVGLPSTLVEQINQFPGDFLVDGEAVGEEYHVFDLLEIGTDCLRRLSYSVRLTDLVKLCSRAMPLSIHLVETLVNSRAKRLRFETLRQAGCEGVVFKYLGAPYASGRPNSGGTQLKYKFYATLTAVVAWIKGRSVSLQLLKGAEWINCGNVAIPPNQPIPGVRTPIDVRYLYAFSESNALFQPIYLGERSDLDPSDCHASQLKFKRSEEDEL